MSKIIYDVYKSTNTKSTSYGKYFGRIIHTETLTTRKLAKHIAEHGSVYTQDVVEGVLTKAEACIVEQLLESKKIKLEGLGTFYLMAENKNGGAVSLEKFNPKTTLKGLHIRFLPDSSSESQLNSKDMLAKANFIWAEDLKRDSAEGRPTDGSSNGGGSQSGSNSGNGDNTNSGNGSQNSGQNSGSNTGDNSGSQSGNNSGNGGNTNTGGNSGSNTGGNTGGNSGSQSGSGDSNQGEPGNYKLLIYKYGSGTSTITDDSEQEINSGASIASGSTVNISVVPAEGKVPSAKLDYNTYVTLTENDGVYTGSFQMPAKGTMLEVHSEPDDEWYDTGD